MGVITFLDVEAFSQRRTQVKFPNIMLNDVNPTTPLIVSILEKGDVPLIAAHKGEKRVVGYVSNSALNMNKIIRTHTGVYYNVSESENVEVKTIIDYLEVV